MDWALLHEVKPPFVPIVGDIIEDIDDDVDMGDIRRQSTVESVFQEFNYFNIEGLKDRR